MCNGSQKRAPSAVPLSLSGPPTGRPTYCQPAFHRWPVDAAHRKHSRLARSAGLDPRWLDVDAAARYLCMSRHSLYHRVNRRQMPFVRQGRVIRFDRFALDRWMAKGVRHGFDEAR